MKDKIKKFLIVIGSAILTNLCVTVIIDIGKHPYYEVETYIQGVSKTFFWDISDRDSDDLHNKMIKGK